MEPHGDLERRGSINNLIERLTAELGPDGSSDGQYSPFGSIRSSPAPWQPAAASSPGHPPHPLYGGERHKLHFGSGPPPPPPPAPPYQADPVSAGSAAAMAGELGTAQISDNLAAHLNGFDTPLFDPRQPPPPPPGSFLSSWLGGWLGCSAPQPGPAGPPPDVSHPPPPPPQPRRPQAEHQPHQTAEPPPPPAPSEPSAPEPIPAPAVASVSSPTPPSPASAPAPSSAPSPAAPSRPSYSAVLAKPAPATGPTLRPAERGARQSAGRATADPETPGGGGGGGGGRRGGRGRRRRVSEAESRPVREEAATATARSPAADGQSPRPEPTDRETESGPQRKGKTRKLTRTVSAGEVVGGAAGRRSETLNNNPDRAQPAVPAGRRPLSFNNNLGPSSTLGPAQTHVHTPPAAAATDGDAAKKVDVNVGKQKNCGKTSNETKKVDIALSKPDNKTLSQSRGSQPLNLLTSGGAAKSERVNKDLAFRARSGGGRGGGRGRRTAEDTGGGGGPGGELLRRLRGQLWPGVALLAALLSWLLHLVLDVAAMSTDLLWTAARSAAEAAHGWLVHWLAAGRTALTARVGAARAWLARPSKAAAAGQREGLPENIVLPTTGEEAMTRLLACKDSDPYSILGVTHDCSDADIRKYYRRQALLVHPDKSRCPGADEAFKILQRAFQLVGAPEKRAEFDSQAREKHEVNEAFRQYMDEMMTRLREKIEETQNTLRCNNCNKRHRRTKVERPVYAARSCTSCQIRHAAREGDIWAESRWLGLLWRYYACMDGAVFDISEWAACQSQALKHLQANHHTVQYRIISGAKRHRQPADEPPDRDLEDILNNLCSGSMSGEAQQGRRRGARRRPH